MENQTAARVRAHSANILKTWERHVQNEIDAAKKASRIVLRDALPRYLEDLASCLNSADKTKYGDDTAAADRCAQDSMEHGQQRAEETEYCLEQVALEYQLLHRTVMEVLDGEGPVPPQDRDFITNFIVMGIRLATAAFLRRRNSQENELRQRFVMSLAHDVRGPLNIIKGYAQLIQMGLGKPTELPVFSSKIIESVDRADGMIKDFLDITTGNGKFTSSMRFEKCSLNEIVSQTIEELRIIFGERLIFEFDEPVNGYWSREGIRRVLENLIGNAVKYGEPGAPVLVSLIPTGDRVKISVKNYGNPISVSDQAELFEPFTRTNKAETGEQMGWGIGLSMVRRMARAHGGDVSVESGLSSGTVFTVEVPLDSRAVKN